MTTEVHDPELMDYRAEVQSFRDYLKSSKRVMALCGAGLSAASGLPTFRGAGGLWRTHDAISLATPEAFRINPSLVWQFYNYRRHMALNVKPNPAHYALAELAKKRKDFITLTQNVDGLSPRAGHPAEQLFPLHGSLFDVKCSEFFCDYAEGNNFTDPIVPALALPLDESDPTTTEARKAKELDISDAKVLLPELRLDDLPHCPKCKKGLLRPGVVWFGERLPEKTLSTAEDWIIASKKIDLIIVIGTSSTVYPAAGYTDRARVKGARVAVVNMERTEKTTQGMREGDWYFQGDAGVILPDLLKDEIGELTVLE
ncbi:DHS-like NAD/FAD-binding domain-containing protein [Patellaria atrata CBS 101060]|uniref:NAD-dependent protein deacylase n=1 Tax=Patellaria atrata CBS 101060 TaxID=1346257 RepID=A0A9P4S7L8_9PEZI|nr:DHS-like NAD/FAD-binding domain-containing protein [Patellaria atrata CBS 101060]